MPKRLSIQPQLTREELQRRYRTAQDPVARSHWQMVWLLAHGTPSEEVAAVTGYSLKWIRTLVQRYNQQGPGGLGDRRRRNPGSMGLLSPDIIRIISAWRANRRQRVRYEKDRR